MAYVFLPKDVNPGKYIGGLAQPIDWKIDRRLCAGKVDDSIVVIVTGERLAPHDHDAFIMFETRYSTGNSTLVYDKSSLRLEVKETNLPLQLLSDYDLYLLMVECYKAVELQKTDYTDTLAKKYFNNTYVIEKHVTDVKPIKTAIFDTGTQYERAPDVYVRPA